MTDVEQKVRTTASTRFVSLCEEESRLERILLRKNEELERSSRRLVRAIEVAGGGTAALPGGSSSVGAVSESDLVMLRRRLELKRAQVASLESESELNERKAELSGRKAQLLSDTCDVITDIDRLKQLHSLKFAELGSLQTIEDERTEWGQKKEKMQRQIGDIEVESQDPSARYLEMKRAEMEDIATRMSQSEAILQMEKGVLQQQVLNHRILREENRGISSILADAVRKLDSVAGLSEADQKAAAAGFALEFGRELGKCLVKKGMASTVPLVRIECLQRAFRIEVDLSSDLISDRIRLAKEIGYHYFQAFAPQVAEAVGVITTPIGSIYLPSSASSQIQGEAFGSQMRQHQSEALHSQLSPDSEGAFEGLRITYAGGLRYGARDGFGVSFHPNGISPSHYGIFSRDVPNGYGVELSPQGTVRARGMFRDGKVVPSGAASRAHALPRCNVSQYQSAFRVLKTLGETYNGVVFLFSSSSCKVFRTPIGVFFQVLGGSVDVQSLEKVFAAVSRFGAILAWKGVTPPLFSPSGMLTVDVVCSPISDLLKTGQLTDPQVVHRILLLTARAVLGLHLAAGVPHGNLNWDVVWTTGPIQDLSFDLRVAYFTTVASRSSESVPNSERNPSFSVDVYAFGIMMYQLISYEVEEGVPLQSMAPFEFMDNLMADALVKNPEDRPSLAMIVGRLSSGLGIQLDLDEEEEG